MSSRLAARVLWTGDLDSRRLDGGCGGGGVEGGGGLARSARARAEMSERVYFF